MPQQTLYGSLDICDGHRLAHSRHDLDDGSLDNAVAETACTGRLRRSLLNQLQGFARHRLAQCRKGPRHV